MKSLLKSVFAAALGLSLSLGPAQANQTQGVNPYDWANPIAWFNMTGVTGQAGNIRNDGFVFHPLKPESWAAIASPQEHNKFHMAMTNPATYTYYMQPGFYMEFMNPANYFAWMNPAAYQTFMDPATFSHWMTPNAYMHTFNPAMYAGMFDMNSYLAWTNPATYMAWMDPNVYSGMLASAGQMATVVPEGQSVGNETESGSATQN